MSLYDFFSVSVRINTWTFNQVSQEYSLSKMENIVNSFELCYFFLQLLQIAIPVVSVEFDLRKRTVIMILFMTKKHVKI